MTVTDLIVTIASRSASGTRNRSSPDTRFRAVRSSHGSGIVAASRRHRFAPIAQTSSLVLALVVYAALPVSADLPKGSVIPNASVLEDMMSCNRTKVCIEHCLYATNVLHHSSAASQCCGPPIVVELIMFLRYSNAHNISWCPS